MLVVDGEFGNDATGVVEPEEAPADEAPKKIEVADEAPKKSKALVEWKQELVAASMPTVAATTEKNRRRQPLSLIHPNQRPPPQLRRSQLFRHCGNRARQKLTKRTQSP